MGRVRRYKKFKACDPFSKRKITEVDNVHDEPPNLFEERIRKDRKRKDLELNDEDLYEVYLRSEAKKIEKKMNSKVSNYNCLLILC
jgi:hypothetical protein